jgi:undecaprenyl-diphosphatase
VTILQAVVLGIVQGLTEFLPISSDGHLALVYRMFGMPADLTFTVFLHGATLLAMLAYFYKDIFEVVRALFSRAPESAGDRRIALLIAVGTVVSAVLALGLGDVVEPASNSLLAIGLGFLATAALLISGEWISSRAKDVSEQPASLTVPQAALVGFLQGLAVMPGVSRSGSTIAAGLFSGLSRSAAARFSFLVGIPIITLATAKDFADLLGGSIALPGVGASAAGFIAAAAAGYAAIWSLLAIVKRYRLYWFAGYTALLGCILLLLATRGG